MKKKTAKVKKTKKEKVEQARLELRIPLVTLNKAKISAAKYAEGNLSAWIRHCLENYIPGAVKGERKGRLKA